MANQVAVVFVQVDTGGAAIDQGGGVFLKCRKTSWADVDLLALNADERYVAVHILHQQSDTGNPNSLIVNGRDFLSLKYTRARGQLAEKMDIKPYDATPTNARVSTLEGSGQANNKQILNRVIPKDVGQAAAFDVNFVLYDTGNSDYDTLDSAAFNFDVLDDANCEILS